MSKTKKAVLAVIYMITVMLAIFFFVLFKISESELKSRKKQSFTRAYEGVISAVLHDNKELLPEQLSFYFSYLKISDDSREYKDMLLSDLSLSNSDSSALLRSEEYLSLLLEYMSKNREKYYSEMSLSLPEYPCLTPASLDVSYELKEKMNEKAGKLLGEDKSTSPKELFYGGRTVYLYSNSNSAVRFDSSGGLIYFLSHKGSRYFPYFNEGEVPSDFLSEFGLPFLRVNKISDSSGDKIIYLKSSTAKATAILSQDGALRAFTIENLSS